jgi:hypothetical protein
VSDQERLRAIAEREQQATKGPWGVRFDSDVTGYPCYFIKGVSGDDKRDVQTLAANARFIEGSRDDVPYLLSLVAQQAQEIQDLRTERDKLEYVNVKQDMQIVAMEQSDADNFKRFMVALSSRDALREALKKIHEYAIGHISPGWESVEEITTAALAETPTEDQR